MLTVVAVLAAVFSYLQLSAPTYHQDLKTRECCLHIAHAGGSVQGVPYSNSLDALDESFARGLRVFELDFSQLGDGEIVLAHDFNEFATIPNDWQAFAAVTHRAGTARLSLDHLLTWLDAHPDVVIITDTKFAGGNEELIARLREVWSDDAIAERFLFQIYSLSALSSRALASEGLAEILTIYRMSDIGPTQIALALQKAAPQALVVPIHRAPRVIPEVRKVLPDLPIYVHGPPSSINSSAYQNGLRLFGASGFFLD